MLKDFSIFYYSTKDESDADPVDDINEQDSNGPEIEPEFEPEDENEEFINKSIKNNNLITIKSEIESAQELKKTDLKSEPYSEIYNLEKDRNLIIKYFKNKSGIYLLHNNINGKEYIGSGLDLGLRLVTYYFPSRLNDNRHISRSILKYGHNNFSLVILCVLGDKDTQSKVTILNAEQKYIDLYKPALNINSVAGSSLGFKHTEESKKLMSDFRKGKKLSLEIKKNLSELFSGELNPFWSKTHSSETLEKMSSVKKGSNNPMFNKEKSPEFIENMFRDKTGVNNPMFGKKKSVETLSKIRKQVYVYDKDKILIKYYESIGSAVKDLHISAESIKKYKDTNMLYKDMYFYSKEI